MTAVNKIGASQETPLGIYLAQLTNLVVFLSQLPQQQKYTLSLN